MLLNHLRTATMGLLDHKLTVRLLWNRNGILLNAAAFFPFYLTRYFGILSTAPGRLESGWPFKWWQSMQWLTQLQLSLHIIQPPSLPQPHLLHSQTRLGRSKTRPLYSKIYSLPFAPSLLSLLLPKEQAIIFMTLLQWIIKSGIIAC